MALNVLENEMHILSVWPVPLFLEIKFQGLARFLEEVCKLLQNLEQR